jgi:hypothetical protein
VLFMLGAAHLFMVAINAAEQAVEAPRPEAGQSARMFSDEPMIAEIEGALSTASTETERQVLEGALAKAKAGEEVELRTLPVTPFLVYVALGLSALGLGLIWLTVFFKSDAAQSIVGVFGGNLIWTGAIEYGLIMASRSLGIGKTVGVIDGQLVAIYGEYVLLKHTWGGLILILVYLMFLESSRCPLFLWWRKRVPMMRGPVVSGRIDNYGPRTAFQYATTVWGFYLLLLWAYDESVFGVHHWVTKAILFASVAGSIYCLRRLHQHTGWGPAVRYAIGAMIVVWTPVEIFAKWGVMREPWLLLEPSTAALFFGGLALGTWALWRAQQRFRNAARRATSATEDGAADNDRLEPAVPVSLARTAPAHRSSQEARLVPPAVA